jgi:peptidoglycan/LPS O-acetylase OafA/YrhL
MTIGLTDGRRHDIDALRVFCFGTIIIYHTSLIYGTKDWWINSIESSRLVDVIEIASHPWRMSLLFFISGLVTASLLHRRSFAEVRSTRTRQLLPPFVLGVLFVVPPQLFFSPHNSFPDLSYWEFWLHHIQSGATLEHMWFLAYLWIYVFSWSVLQPKIQRHWPNLSASLATRLQGKGLYIVPIMFLMILRLCLYPVFGVTLVIATDFYAHALYFSMFMAGSLLVNEKGFWQEIDRQRWISLAVAILSLLALTGFYTLNFWQDMQEIVPTAMNIIWPIFQWCAMMTLLAFAGRIASRPNRVVTYLNKSTMTYYIAHQTVIVIVAYYVAQAGLLDIWSFIPIVVATAIICAIIAEAKTIVTARLVPWIFNLASVRKSMSKPVSSDVS